MNQVREGDHVIRNRDYPIIGTVVRVWVAATGGNAGKEYARVRWDGALSGSRGVHGDDGQGSKILAASLLPATDENVAMRLAAWKEADARWCAKHGYVRDDRGRLQPVKP